jgi:bacillithiol system protein YtxJ
MFEFLKKQEQLVEADTHIQEIMNRDQYKSLVASTEEKPLFLLKHSTRCPVSDWAMTEFKLAAKELDGQAVFAFVDLIVYRDVSNHIAAETGIPHQSPQLFFFHKKKALDSVTHEEVKASQIKSWLNQIKN